MEVMRYIQCTELYTQQIALFHDLHMIQGWVCPCQVQGKASGSHYTYNKWELMIVWHVFVWYESQALFQYTGCDSQCRHFIKIRRLWEYIYGLSQERPNSIATNWSYISLPLTHQYCLYNQNSSAEQMAVFIEMNSTSQSQTIYERIQCPASI